MLGGWPKSELSEMLLMISTDKPTSQSRSLYIGEGQNPNDLGVRGVAAAQSIAGVLLGFGRED